jgi:oxygen-independent coproporphyrinogen-3 oxidase
MAGIYIHIPFCKQACHYCDFHFSTNQTNRRLICEAIAKEITLQTSYLKNEPIETVYLGGGTPSILTQEELEIIFTALYSNFIITKQVEITLEANPDDLTKEKLKILKEASVNRLSIGIQSFQEETLQLFNRAHTPKDAIECISLAREAGFSNISIDLIYAVPSQENSQWKKDVDQALALQPEHLSAYSLTIEEKTAFGKWQKTGRIKPIEETKAVADFELLMDSLAGAGYEHYEISNFCLKGYHSKHNSSYWRQQNYLGVGPSAHSYNGGSRQHNIGNNHLYLKSLAQGKVPSEMEVLTRENKINEYIFTTLRTQWGCDLDYLAKHLNYSLLDSVVLQQLLNQQLLTLQDSIIRLTRRGKLLADQVAVDLFVSN